MMEKKASEILMLTIFMFLKEEVRILLIFQVST